jgi:hypothetical protein
MSFVATVRDRLVSEKSVHNLSRNSEFADFYYIGYKATPFVIDFVTLIGADGLTERQIVDLRDKFFSAVQAVSYEFGLRPGPRNPNGLLVFIFEGGCPNTLIRFIQKQSRANNSFRKSAVTVSWAIDVQKKTVFTHDNPVSFIPPIVILKQTVFPGVGFLNEVLEQYTRPAQPPHGSTTPRRRSESIESSGSDPGKNSRFGEAISDNVMAQLRLMQTRIEEILATLHKMPDQPKYSFPNAQKVQIIEQIDTYIENAADADRLELRQALLDLQQEITALKQRYPDVKTEAEAQAVVEAEIVVLKQNEPQRWHKLLELQRWWNGARSSTLNVGEHLTEQSIWGKAVLGFLEGFSEDID